MLDDLDGLAQPAGKLRRCPVTRWIGVHNRKNGRNSHSAVPALRPPPRPVQRIELQSVTIPSQLAKLVLAAPLLFQRIKQVAKSGEMVVGDRDRDQIIDDIAIPLPAGPLSSEKKPLIIFRRTGF